MHIDTHSAFTGDMAIVCLGALDGAGGIVSLSTGSAAIMQFRKGEEKQRLLLPRRSLLIMDGEARYCWSVHFVMECRNGCLCLGNMAFHRIESNEKGLSDCPSRFVKREDIHARVLFSHIVTVNWEHYHQPDGSWNRLEEMCQWNHVRRSS